jgi:hypothetical protein
MKLQSLVVVVLRLLALNFLLQVAVQLTPQVLMTLKFYQHSQIEGMSSYFALPLMVLAGLVVGAILLWFLALPIARLVTRGVPQDLSFGAMSLVDCYSIAFISVGLFYISSHLPQALNWAHFLFVAVATHSGNSWKDGVSGYDISQAFIPFIIGVLLFVYGRKWAVMLARKQAEATPTASDTHESGINTPGV